MASSASLSAPPSAGAIAAASTASNSGGALVRTGGGGGDPDLIVGRTVVARDRLRWVRLVSGRGGVSGESRGNIQQGADDTRQLQERGREDESSVAPPMSAEGGMWFPALVYESYEELFGDIHRSQKRLRSKIFLQRKREAGRSRPVAFLVGLEPPTILPLPGRSVAEADADGTRVLDFMDRFDDVTDDMSRALSSRPPSDGRSMVEVFDRAVDAAMRHLDGSDDGDDDVVRIMPSDGSDEEAVAKLLCSTMTTSSQRRSEPTMQPGGAEPSRADPRNTAKPDAGAASGRPPLPPAPPDLSPNDEWRSVWAALRRSGWTYEEGAGGHARYVKPGRSVRDGRKGVDYFTREADVREFASRHYGWVDPLRLMKRRDRPRTDSDEEAEAQAERRRGRWVSLSPRTAAEQAKLMAEGAAMETPPDAAPSASVSQQKEEPEPLAPTPQRAASESVPEIIGTPISASDSWLNVWEKLKHSGWEWTSGSGIYDFFYVLPGRSVKTGKIGKDYFVCEDQMKQYVREHYGWTGYDCGRKATSKEGRSCDPKKKQGVKEKGPKPSNAEDASTNLGGGTEDSQITAINQSDSWSLVFKKLKKAGWTWKKGSGLMTGYYYIAPGGNTKTGTKGIDFFTSEEEVKDFVRKKYQWSDPSLDKNTAGKKRKRSHENQAESVRGGRKKGGVPTSVTVKSTSSQPSVRRKIMAETHEPKKARKQAREKGKSKSKKKKSSDRQADKKGKSKKNTVTKKKSSPAKHSPPGRIWGIPPETEKRKDSRTPGSSDRTPSGQPTQLQDPGAPIHSSLSSSSAGNDSSGSSIDSNERYAWSSLWPQLKKYGWFTVPAGRLNSLHDWYWVRPNKNPKDPSTKLGVDYFCCITDVVEYQKMMDRQEKERSTAGPGRQNKRGTPPEESKSAVMDEFDREAEAASAPTKGPGISSPASARNGSPRSVRKGLTSAEKSGQRRRRVISPWWKSTPFVSFTKTVWPILLKKLKFRYSSGYYYLPDGRYAKHGGSVGVDWFESSCKLREALCRLGVPNLHSPNEPLSDDEMNAVVRWASTAHVENISDHSSPSALESVRVLSSGEAWNIFHHQLDYRRVNEIFYAPGMHNRGSHAGLTRGKDYFHSMEELQCNIRANGLENIDGSEVPVGRAGRSDHNDSKTKAAALSHEDRLALMLWASSSPLPAYVTTHTEERDSREVLNR